MSADVVVAGTARLSQCGSYRYALTRSICDQGSRTVTFVMLNPSTADAERDDPTIRKCRGFAARWRFSRLVVVNVFAYRATEPRELIRAARAGADVCGPDNDHWIDQLVTLSDLCVLAWGAWGAHAALADNTYRVRDRILAVHRKGLEVGALGFTKDSQPKHPLMVPYHQPCGLWPEARR